MSEHENQPPTPSKQTSSVPLKKETVRVTLKAADAPAVPASTVPLAPPVRPPVPGGAPRPPAPAPTVPLRPPGAAATPGAATTPAPTIRLAPTSPVKPATPTAPLTPPGGAPTLPKATVQLQPPTAPLGVTSPALAPSLQIEDGEEGDSQEGLLNILSGVGLAAALVVLVLQLMTANVWISAEDNLNSGDWSQIIQ